MRRRARRGRRDAAARRATAGRRAEPGGVFVCATTRELVGALFDARSVTPGSARGAGRGIAGSEEDRRRQPLRGPARRRAELLGRDEELALLLRRWQQVGSGAGRVVLVAAKRGSASRGSSPACARRSPPQPPCWRLRLRAAPPADRAVSGRGPTRASRRIHAPDDTAPRRAKLERMLVARVPTAQLERDATLVAEVLGVADEARQARSQPAPSASRELLLDCMLEQVGAASRATRRCC